MKKILALLLIGVMIMASNSAVVSEATSGGKVNVSLIGRYDSADTAAIRSIDVDKKEIRLRNHSTGKTYTLSYDNTSMMYDIYGRALSPRLLEVGQIVDVTFCYIIVWLIGKMALPAVRMHLGKCHEEE